MMTSINGELSMPEATRPAQPIWLRVTHWVNALAMVLMVMSGWRIYNASPLFGFTFPEAATIGGWLGGALLWHFAAMWLLVANGLIYVVLSLVTGRFRRRMLPVSLAGAVTDARAALSGRLDHSDPHRYNQLQKLLYLLVLLAGVVVVLSGISIWKSVQLQELTALFGGYDNARFVHFYAMAFIVGFTLLHTIVALFVPRSLRAMIIGS